LEQLAARVGGGPGDLRHVPTGAKSKTRSRVASLNDTSADLKPNPVGGAPPGLHPCEHHFSIRREGFRAWAPCARRSGTPASLRAITPKRANAQPSNGGQRRCPSRGRGTSTAKPKPANRECPPLLRGGGSLFLLDGLRRPSPRPREGTPARPASPA